MMDNGLFSLLDGIEQTLVEESALTICEGVGGSKPSKVKPGYIKQLVLLAACFALVIAVVRVGDKNQQGMDNSVDVSTNEEIKTRYGYSFTISLAPIPLSHSVDLSPEQIESVFKSDSLSGCFGDHRITTAYGIHLISDDSMWELHFTISFQKSGTVEIAYNPQGEYPSPDNIVEKTTINGKDVIIKDFGSDNPIFMYVVDGSEVVRVTGRSRDTMNVLRDMIINGEFDFISLF